jgi:hypothetical protein
VSHYERWLVSYVTSLNGRGRMPRYSHRKGSGQFWDVLNLHNSGVPAIRFSCSRSRRGLVRMIRKKFRRAGVVAVASAMLGIGLAQVADAAPASAAAYACQNNQVCFFESTGFRGSAFVPPEMNNQAGNVPNFQARQFTNGDNANDRVQSIFNGTGWCVAVYTEAYFGGSRALIILPHRGEFMEGSFVNSISSAKFQFGHIGGCP